MSENFVYVPAAAGFYRLVAYFSEGQIYHDTQPIAAWCVVSTQNKHGDRQHWADPVGLEQVGDDGLFEAVLCPDGRVCMFETEFSTRQAWEAHVKARFEEMEAPAHPHTGQPVTKRKGQA